MTNMWVFHRDILISQDGEEVTDAALTEAHITGDTTRTAQLRAQLAMIGELNTAIAVVMGVDEPTLTALQHEDMIGAEVAVTATCMPNIQSDTPRLPQIASRREPPFLNP